MQIEWLKMKYTMVLLFFLLASEFINAQISTHEIKEYSYKTTDKYNPKLASGLAVVPGLGHFYSGNYLRGLIYLAGMATSAYLIAAGGLSAWASDWDGDPQTSGEGQITIGIIGFIGFYTLNFIDAARVAKIENLKIREHQISFELSPCFQSHNNLTAGISLHINF